MTETFTRPQLLKAVEDARSRFEFAGQSLLDGLKRENEELRAALVPFANCVFADNGDITVNSGRLCAGDFLRAAMLTTFDARPPKSQESGETGE